MPFSLRLIHAELPQHNGRPNVALDRIYALLEKVEQVLCHLEQGLSEDGSDQVESGDGEESSQEELIGKCFSLSLLSYTLRYLPSNRLATNGGFLQFERNNGCKVVPPQGPVT